MKGRGWIGAAVVGAVLTVGGGSECWVYPGHAREDGSAGAVSCHDVAGWRDVVYLQSVGA
ncbi:MAG: hypothetical protein AYP45_12545 [Candidatus Brocadia carolinensis]|uniref:Uncharacterized protein n=1 Tax=Candidatus Brocadia carolinensis TaxID=1004156 RepID=A0A1V4ART3_9BACT|nr:MAG: hypothetical protein AYP45_12545 [Candidatus Brocadia caroliniensis]